MLSIDEDKLKLFLERRKSILEKKGFKGMPEIVSAISLIVTLCLSDIRNVKFINPIYFEIIVWIIAISIFFWGCFTLIMSIKQKYSIEQLYREITELDPNTEHLFNVVIIKKDGKYLLFNNIRWKCLLFPNYQSSKAPFDEATELKYTRKRIKKDLNISKRFNLKYSKELENEKLSVADKVNKRYVFHFFVSEDIETNFTSTKNFRCNGTKYYWKTMVQMYQDRNMKKKNKDVLDFVRKMYDIS